MMLFGKSPLCVYLKHNLTVLSYLFLQLHTDSISLLEEDGVAPKQVPERGELVETPFSERPQSQLSLPLRPRHWRAQHKTRVNTF